MNLTADDLRAIESAERLAKRARDRQRAATMRALVTQRRAAGLCKCGASPTEGYASCERCRAIVREAKRRRAAGLPDARRVGAR